MRRDAIKKFLVGTKPYEKGLFRVVSMYNEMQKHGTLTRGSIELQYNSHLKAMAALRRADMAKRQSALTKEAMRSANSGGFADPPAASADLSPKAQKQPSVV
jgi:hypothetical protein